MLNDHSYLEPTNSMGVSIITAVGFNTDPEDLLLAIESVHCQVCRVPIEHVIVYDGTASASKFDQLVADALTKHSFDCTHARLPIPDIVLTTTLTVPQCGPGGTKAAGLEMHKYRYVMFLDADDMLAGPDAVDTLVAVATSSEAPIVQGAVLLEDNSYFLCPTAKQFGDYEYIIRSVREKFARCRVFDHPVTHGKLFDSTVVKLEFNLETDMCDEAYGIVKAMYANDVAIVPDAIYILCDTPGSISKSQSYEKLLAIRRYREWVRRFANDKLIPLPDKYYRESCNDYTLFGLHILRIDKYKYRTQVYLFGKLVYSSQAGL